MQEGMIVHKPLRLLDMDEIHMIHNAVLTILEKSGVVYESKWALDLLNENGCHVDYKTGRAYIPEHLVNEAINNSPRIIKLCGRNPKYNLKLEGTRVYFAGGANAVRVVEFDGTKFKSRQALTDDLIKLTILADALENVHCYLAPVYPQDVPPRGVDRVKCEIALNYTEKHFYHDAEGYEGALDQIKMASIVVGGEDNLRKCPIISLAPCITSPFTWSESALGVLKACAEKSVPAIISSETISGATAPITLAGSLVQQCAEVISGLVLAQLLKKGAPTIACTLPAIMDMRTANIVLSSIETGLMCAGAAQIFREFYGIPYVGAGGISDSKVPDEQAGYEKAITALYNALGGANLIHLATGMLDFILSISPEQMVIDDEIIGMILHSLKGINVNEETLALDVIMNVGPRGNFLTQKHTLKYLRKEHYIPKISDRLSRESWESGGAKDILMRAREKVAEILKTHRPEPLEEDVRKMLKEIRERAQKTYQ